MPEGATVGASTGGVVGGTIGLLAGIGALAIPGLGPFIAAGPIMAAPNQRVGKSDAMVSRILWTNSMRNVLGVLIKKPRGTV